MVADLATERALSLSHDLHDFLGVNGFDVQIEAIGATRACHRPTKRDNHTGANNTEYALAA
jgi:hypothetical protein